MQVRGRGVGFYFRNVTELILFGVRGKNARTLAPGRRQVNLLATRKREHSRKPDELYPIIEACSSGPWLELFSRPESFRDGWTYHGEIAADEARVEVEGLLSNSGESSSPVVPHQNASQYEGRDHKDDDRK